MLQLPLLDNFCTLQKYSISLKNTAPWLNSSIVPQKSVTLIFILIFNFRWSFLTFQIIVDHILFYRVFKGEREKRVWKSKTVYESGVDQRRSYIRNKWKVGSQCSLFSLMVCLVREQCSGGTSLEEAEGESIWLLATCTVERNPI